ncbi:MAG: DUF971 domain-containing protein [Fulvimarina manganoxydans]|uniref:DUF971 domain-containing protein n=1 Tax=Fulvimarina manganoxydans TaxID=937218 RepID=UPI0023579450|nr:DUF971 domain-containing protein [Fulvimarina manganoxydans]MCK5930608.1 DUF971 domain-containing protein [Fulvimarina manganoxydans]
MQAVSTPPNEIRVASDRATLTLGWPDREPAMLSAEFLRVLSPSAEVRGHSPADRKTMFGKRSVTIANITPVGNYAVRILFSDGHDTGIYTWTYLRELADEREARWEAYLGELEEKGLSRD